MNSNQNNFFVIISPPRCRSTYLRGLIGSHPDVVCHNEVYHQDETSLYLEKLDSNADLFNTVWRDNNPLLFIQRMIEETKRQNPGAKWVGCKLLITEEQMQGFDALLKLRPRVIIITRHNKLAWYSSLKIAIETRCWAVHDSPISQHKVTFDANEFEGWNKAQNELERNTYAKLQENNIHYLKFDYEELIENSTINKILQFLEIPEANLFPDIAEQNSIHILNRFNNPDDVICFAASINQPSWVNQAEQATQHITKQRQHINFLKQQVIELEQKLNQRITSVDQPVISLENKKNEFNLEHQQDLTLRLAEATAKIEAYESSKSWRITAPLRVLANFWRMKFAMD